MNAVVCVSSIIDFHFLVAANIARNSRLNVEYIASMSDSFLEKNVTGLLIPSSTLFRQARIAYQLTSAVIVKCQFFLGNVN